MTPAELRAAASSLQPALIERLKEADTGRKVPDQRQLRLWASQTAPNTKVNLKVLRNGKEQKFTVTLGEMPTEFPAGEPNSTRPVPQKKSDALDGVEVTDLDTRTRRQMSIPANVQGALVTGVDQDSMAAEAGLKQGDVILEIDQQKVKNAQEAIDRSEKIKTGEQILLRVWSGRNGGGNRFLVVEPTKPAKDEK